MQCESSAGQGDLDELHAAMGASVVVTDDEEGAEGVGKTKDDEDGVVTNHLVNEEVDTA